MTKKAFTLAEVLITLGIIGIVAAMTLPAVTTKINNIKFKSGFKKSLSVLNQAVNLNKAKYDFDFSTIGSNCINENTDNSQNVQSMCSIFNSSLVKPKAFDYTNLYIDKNQLYYRYVYEKSVTSDTLIKEQHIQLYYYQMNDGAILAFHSPPKGSNNETNCTLNNTTLEQAMNDELFQKYCIGFIDVNGVKRPNKEIRCNDNKAHYTDINSECSVDEVTDIFPVIYYDSVLAPGSAAARAVLYK